VTILQPQIYGVPGYDTCVGNFVEIIFYYISGHVADLTRGLVGKNRSCFEGREKGIFVRLGVT